MFENVDGRTDGRTTDGRTTDAGVTGILIAHLGAFGSGELKITKLRSQHSMMSHHRLSSKTPYKCRFAGGPMIACL